MATKSERDLSRIGWLDYVLMSVGSCLAVFCAGMSITQPAVSYFCVGMVIVGTLVSYTIRLLTLKSPWIRYDAIFYGAGVLISIFFAAPLRDIMPEGGFPREIAAAGWLSWMLILGSFATWQDSTLLFQAIPALALFGLIGCYDTYKGVTIAFFAFLMCLTTLFARAHGRQMLKQAADSGYFTRHLAPGSPIPSVETTPGLAKRLKEGPWRWVAGPEWALASALAVVMLSLLGAPVIRQSVSGVAGFVQISVPTPRNRPSAAGFSGGDIQGSSLRVGRAYVHSATPDRPLFSVHLDKLRYLRSETYDRYTGHGWQDTDTQPVADQSGQKTATDLAIGEMKKARSYEFEIDEYRPLHMLPLPAEVNTLSVEGADIRVRRDGTYESGTLSPEGNKIQGTSAEAGADITPTVSAKPDLLRPLLDQTGIPVSVAHLAVQVSANARNDFEKAVKIRDDISGRITYNLDAPETPNERDPVEYALFDHQEGYCTIFASSMVLMARAVGIPARYVQGYLPDERRKTGPGVYQVTDTDYHAWAELFFKDVGWVVFDPSVGAAAKDGEGLGDNGDTRAWYQKTPVIVAGDVLVMFAIGAALVLGGRSFRAYRQSLHQRTELERVFMAFIRDLERAVRKRRVIGQTPDEFLSLVAPSLGPLADEAVRINEEFIVAMFASASVAPGVVDALRRRRKEFKTKLRATPRAAHLPEGGLN